MPLCPALRSACLHNKPPTDRAMFPALQSPAIGLYNIASGSWKIPWENLTLGKVGKQAPQDSISDIPAVSLLTGGTG